MLVSGLEDNITEINTIIDVSYNQQMRKVWPTKSKVPCMQKRNTALKNEFYELITLKERPEHVQRLLLVAAVFT